MELYHLKIISKFTSRWGLYMCIMNNDDHDDDDGGGYFFLGKLLHLIIHFDE